MNRSTIVFTCLCMTFAGLLFLSEVRGVLNGAKEQKELAQFWKSKVAREQAKKLIVMGRFADFKQDVGLLLPNKSKQNQKLRDLASVIPHEVSEISLVSSRKMLDKGKASVKKRDFKKAVETLKALINKFPDSFHVVEAHYLIIEAYYQQEKNMNVIKWADKMVELFPENRLTGYALLKIGGLYELDGRPEDAVRIYKTIVAVYQDKKLVTQARVAVSELEL